MRTRSRAVALSLSLAIMAGNAGPASGAAERAPTAGATIARSAPGKAPASQATELPRRRADHRA
jgi:hypothetical protein